MEKASKPGQTAQNIVVNIFRARNKVEANLNGRTSQVMKASSTKMTYTEKESISGLMGGGITGSGNIIKWMATASLNGAME